jgi:hypothetical protein
MHPFKAPGGKGRPYDPTGPGVEKDTRGTQALSEPLGCHKSSASCRAARRLTGGGLA